MQVKAGLRDRILPQLYGEWAGLNLETKVEEAGETEIMCEGVQFFGSGPRSDVSLRWELGWLQYDIIAGMGGGLSQMTGKSS